MKTLETTQFANSIATITRQGATSTIERSIVNARSTASARREGSIAVAASSITGSVVINKTTQSSAFQVEAETTGSTGLNTSRVINRGGIFNTTSEDVRMETCYFINSRSGGFAASSASIRGIADQVDASETGNWKISNYQSGIDSARIAKAA